MLQRAPGPSVVAIVSLALGIAIVTTVFGWVHGILIDPLPGVADASRMVTIETVAPSGTMIDSSFPDYQTIRDHTRLMSGVIAFKERLVGVGIGPRTDRAWALMVTGNYFDVLGVKPALGRFFQGDEESDTIERHPVAVLSHTMWAARYQSDPDVVGRTIELNRHPYTIIGVAPAGFFGTITGLDFNLYVPLTMQASLTGADDWLSDRNSRPLYLFGRLKEGATIDQARAELATVAAASAEAFPNTNRGISATVLPMREARRGLQHELGAMLELLFAVGAIVLLIVCANVANLQLARAAARRAEMGIRLGLGASRGALIRQVLTEGLVMGALAGALAVLASAWLVGTLRLFLPFVEYPLVLPTTIRGEEVLFAAGVSVLASVLFTVVPALRLSRAGIVDAMNTVRQTEGRRAGRMGSLLVVAQVALALAALVTAGLLLRSFENARRINPGFDTHNVLLMGINLSTAGYTRDRGLQYLDRVVDRVRSMPGVDRVALAEDVPLGLDGGSWTDLRIDGYVPGSGENMKIYRNLVSPGYFGLMKIPLRDGRDFTIQDAADRPLVAIVNETFARRFFGGRAVGRGFTAGGSGSRFTVVGVVSDSKYHALAEPSQPYFYVALRQLFDADTGVALQMRTRVPPLSLAPAVLDAIRGIDPSVPPPVTTTLAEYTSAAYFIERLAASLIGVLGGLALLLSGIGLYSLMAYRVARRHREIGVRVALGATGADILRLVIRRGLALVGAGVAVGVLLALAGSRAIASLLFGVGPFDPATLAGATVLLLLVAMLASYIPGRAAARLDPVRALRAE